MYTLRNRLCYEWVKLSQGSPPNPAVTTTLHPKEWDVEPPIYSYSRVQFWDTEPQPVGPDDIFKQVVWEATVLEGA